MNSVYRVRLALACTVMVLLTAFPVFGGALDNHYLAAFGEQPGQALQKAVLFQADSAVHPRCGTPLKHGLHHDWNRLEPVTQKTLAKQLAAPLLTHEATYPSIGGHFLIHYATSGSEAPSPPNGYGLLSWVQTVADTFESVYADYTKNRGYRPPPASSRYDIYLRDLASLELYGQTTSLDAAPVSGFPNAYRSYIEIDKDFTASLYTNAANGPYLPLQSLQVSAAHEFHHAIQYGYNYYFEIWYGEATSTWFEDELYDQINQLYNYLPRWFSNSTQPFDLAVGAAADTGAGAGYGRWIYNRYLAERHGLPFIKSIWEKLAGVSPVDGNDIPMLPVIDGLLSSAVGESFGTDFFTFTKRVYTREWSSHLNEITKIHAYVPQTTITTYPLSPPTSITLPHYSFAYYKFAPSITSPRDLNITVTATSGISTTAFRRNGTTITELPFARTSGGTVTIPFFSTSDEAVLLLVNTTATDNQNANFSSDGSSVAVTNPVVPPAVTGTDSSSGKSGCFIATAAYGSYLHPQVQLLRDFRDRHLLTNPAGRLFVAFYYRYSPPLAEIIARHEIARGMTRMALTPLVVVVSWPAPSAMMVAGLILGLFYRRHRRHRISLLLPDE